MAAPSELSAPIDLGHVRRLFARPERLQLADFLRREVASRMHERLDLVKVQPKRILDAGCGTGADLSVLQQRFAAAQVVGVDGSLPMLRQAQAALPAASGLQSLIGKLLPRKAGLDLACADFANLPFGVNAFDLVWSNLALHWHPQPDQVFAEWRRVLSVDGLLMFSTFGPDTFKQVRAAFAALDDAPHTLPFVDMHDFGDQLVAAGLSTPVMDMEVLTLTYDSVDAMLADVRAFGGNPLATRRKGLIGRAGWARVRQALEAQRRADGTLALSLEVIYGHAFRPAPRVTAAGESIVRFMPRK